MRILSKKGKVYYSTYKRTCRPLPGLKAIRESRGVSVFRLAKAAGLKYDTVRRIENGGVANLETQNRLARTLEVRLNTLINGGKTDGKEGNS